MLAEHYIHLGSFKKKILMIESHPKILD
jgi:hypothetical protein